MSFSRIRNRIESLERKLALPLAVVRLRPLVEEFCWQWQVATVERKSLPDPHSLIPSFRRSRARACTSAPLAICEPTSSANAKRVRSRIRRI